MRKKTKSTRKKTMRRRRCWKGGDPMEMSLAQGKDYLDIHKNQHGGMAPVGTTGVLDDSLRATARIGVLDQSMQQIQGMSDQSGGGKRKGLVQRLGKKLKNIAGTVKRSLVGRRSYPRKLMDALRMRKSMLGGKRRKASRKRKGLCGGKRKAMSRKRKGMMGMMGGKASCMRRRMRGGAAMTPLATAQDYSAPGELLSPQGEARAMMGMNPEWKLAADPNSFAPK
jgi:hypothetical protein